MTVTEGFGIAHILPQFGGFLNLVLGLGWGILATEGGASVVQSEARHLPRLRPFALLRVDSAVGTTTRARCGAAL